MGSFLRTTIEFRPTLFLRGWNGMRLQPYFFRVGTQDLYLDSCAAPLSSLSDRLGSHKRALPWAFRKEKNLCNRLEKRV